MKSWDEDSSDNTDSKSSSDSDEDDYESGMYSIIFPEPDKKVAVWLELWHRGNSEVTDTWHKDIKHWRETSSLPFYVLHCQILPFMLSMWDHNTSTWMTIHLHG